MLEVVRDGEEYRECLSREEPHVTLQAGPGPVGGFVRFVLEPGRIELGRSAAPEVVRAFRFADRALGTDFGGSMLPATCDARGGGGPSFSRHAQAVRSSLRRTRAGGTHCGTLPPPRTR